MSTASPSTNSALTSQTGARFHLSLNVADLPKSIAFFQVFFGCEPAKNRGNYAKFELADPPLVLSLEPHRAPPGGNLNHLGFRLEDSAALVEVQRRLELAGISTLREEGVECCYARQTKFWVHDPDGNMWEVYTLHEDLEHCGDGRLPVIELATADAIPPAIWNHQLGQPFPARLPILDGTVDIVRLQGTLNERLPQEETERRLRESLRILKPGGRVEMHFLTADRELGEQTLRLPGPAAVVQYVPVDNAVLQLLADCGFAEPRFSFRAASPCFHVGDAELRETRIEAKHP